MRRSLSLSLVLLVACSSSPSSGGADAPGGGGDGPGSGSGSADAHPGIDAPHGDAAVRARHVIVIPLENKDEVSIYGDTADAPYINGLMGTTAAYATGFTDELDISIPSEPHYIWMEAGTNVFSDHTFTTDADSSGSNSTSSTAHLSTQLTAAGLTWTAYQEGIVTACPTASFVYYAAKHQPFTFFQDVSGSPPDSSNAGCGAHFKTIDKLATDLAADDLPSYAFVTPNLCHEMHGALGCPSEFDDHQNIAAGDAWLAANLPALIAYTHTHDALIFLTWDEGESTRKIPFLALGDSVIAGSDSTAYTHSSQLKTVEEYLGVPVLPAVASANDMSAMLQPGTLAP